MRILKTKTFARYADSEEISDHSLKKAVEKAEKGLIDANLGLGLIKQRVARQGQGSSGGYRVLIAYKVGELAIFLLGFAKNEQENITAGELDALREMAKKWTNIKADQLEEYIKSGSLQEVKP